jgi:hypothetical protein
MIKDLIIGVTFKKIHKFGGQATSSPKSSESAFNNANTSLVEASLVVTDIDCPKRLLAVFGKTVLSQTQKIFNTLDLRLQRPNCHTSRVVTVPK